MSEAYEAGKRDKINGYPCEPAFRAGTLEHDEYIRGYHDTHKLHTS